MSAYPSVVKSSSSVVDPSWTDLESGLRAVRVGLLGFGRIGQAVAAGCTRERETLAAAGVELLCQSALVRSSLDARGGFDLVTLTHDGHALVAGGVDVVVEALGGVEPARTLVALALSRGIPVVTANKSLMAAHGPELRAIAARAGVPLLYDAAVLAGVPCIGQLSRRPLAASARRIAGVLNGTSSFILHEIARGAAFSDALLEAQARGYAEPDSRADVSGRDAAEKLTILLHLAGYTSARADALTTLGIDAIAPEDFAHAKAMGGTIAPVVLAHLSVDDRGAWVGPAFVAAGHPFAQLHGVTNALSVTSGNGRASLFIGAGAGPDATAATIVDDIIEAVTTPLPALAAGRAANHPSAGLAQPPASSWFVRIDGGAALSAAHVAEFLGASHVPALQVVSSGGVISARTVRAGWASIRRAATAFESCGARVLVLPALDAPSDSRPVAGNEARA